MNPYYESNGVVIYNGDALEVLPELVGVAGFVTDPPYSSGGQFRGDRTSGTLAKYVQTGSVVHDRVDDFTGDNRDQRAYLAWCSMWMAAARHAAIPGAVLVTFTDWRQLPTLSDAVQVGGWVWRNVGTWYKPGVRMQRGRFSLSSEYVLYATNGPAADHDGCPQNVHTEAPVPATEKQHAAQKPLGVVRWATSVVPPGGLIVDPFMGTGTGLVAARDFGFSTIGIELSERYCEIAARRLDQAVLDFDGEKTEVVSCPGN